MQASDLLESVHVLRRTSKRIQKEKRELLTSASLHRQRIRVYQKELDELKKEEQLLTVTGAFGVIFWHIITCVTRGLICSNALVAVLPRQLFDRLLVARLEHLPQKLLE